MICLIMLYLIMIILIILTIFWGKKRLKMNEPIVEQLQGLKEISYDKYIEYIVKLLKKSGFKNVKINREPGRNKPNITATKENEKYAFKCIQDEIKISTFNKVLDMLDNDMYSKVTIVTPIDISLDMNKQAKKYTKLKILDRLKIWNMIEAQTEEDRDKSLEFIRKNTGYYTEEHEKLLKEKKKKDFEEGLNDFQNILNTVNKTCDVLIKGVLGIFLVIFGVFGLIAKMCNGKRRY